MKAEISGAKVKNPGRFADRKAPKDVRPLGEPYENMTVEQKAAWAEFEAELPWLNSTHRGIVRMTCFLMAKLHASDITDAQMKILGPLLSKLGATPVDETKVNHDSGEKEEPEDKFFGRPN